MIDLRVKRSRLHWGCALLIPITLSVLQGPATWELVPELYLGTGSEASHFEFTEIVKIVVAPDGTMFVADSRDRTIRVFSEKGQHLRTIGRRGSGPGEFEQLRNIGLLADTLWVIDGRLRRTSAFSREGTLLMTMRTEFESSSSLASLSQHVDALLAGGHAFGGASPGMLAGQEAQSAVVPLLLMTRTGRVLDTLGWLHTKNGTIATRSARGTVIFGAQRFADAALAIMASSTSTLFIVERSVSTSARDASFRVVAVHASSDTLWDRRYTYVPRRLEKASADSFRLAVNRAFARSGYSAAEIERVAFIPDYRPPVTAGVAGQDGSLWLRREEGRSTVEYWVIGRDGARIANVTVPSNVTILATTDSKAWGVQIDDYDVPRVIRYRIHRP